VVRFVPAGFRPHATHGESRVPSRPEGRVW
jgi:hypothetical protein